MNKPELTAATPGLDFRTYDLRAAGSVSALFTNPLHRCGIYVLDFADGMTYVGQTVNIVTRFAKHRRTWSDIVGLRFAECTRADLTALERIMIRRQESIGDVRNRNETGKPGGSGDMAITTAAGVSVSLPWERARRIGLRPIDLAYGKATDRQESQYARLMNLSGYPDLRRVLARYIAETIPDPTGTQGIWSVTAMAGYNASYPRVATISIGQIEVIRAYQDASAGGELGVAIEVRGGDEFQRALHAVAARKLRRRYFIDPSVRKLNYPVQAITCDDLDIMHRLLALDVIREAAYKLNVTLMRQGSRAFSRYHNPIFAADLLRG